MILHDLNQKIINEVSGFFMQALGNVAADRPNVEKVREALASDAKRYSLTLPRDFRPAVELWFTQDANQNIIFTFYIPTDLPKSDLEKAEAAKAIFDKTLQQYLVDYYI
ncbi:hypothetical protein C4546_00235 [Candidatus Parcubacteria bacterium]|jgi:hypothetical protein|nr:MAG: hypothetical protein C4546_00235 [Candidatus Parcubacteria bacterium]